MKATKTPEFKQYRRDLLPLALPHFGKPGLAKRIGPIIDEYLSSKSVDELKRPRLAVRLMASLAANNARYANPVERVKRVKNFFDSEQWLAMRYETLRRCGAKCLCCGRGAKEGVIIHVDHIKPRATYPELELDLDNLQVLCSECNRGKSNLDETDWRVAAPAN